MSGKLDPEIIRRIEAFLSSMGDSRGTLALDCQHGSVTAVRIINGLLWYREPKQHPVASSVAGQRPEGD